MCHAPVQVPIYKSIEQQRRVSNKGVFAFSSGDELGSGPPDPKVWPLALQNRTYKTTLISRVCSILSNKFVPRHPKSELIIDFVDTVRVRSEKGVRCHDRLDSMVPMGESDVKFMRFVSLYGDILIDSIDSDVLLIAMLQVQRQEFRHRVLVRRYAANVAGHKRAAGAEGADRPKTRRYEIVDVCRLLKVLQGAVRQAVGSEVVLSAHQTTHIIVVLALLTGSDFSRKLPLVGPRHLWDQLGTLVPYLLMCSSEKTHDGALEFVPELWLDVFIKHVYCQKFEAHVRGVSDDATLAEVLEALRGSALAERTKNLLPTPAQAACTLQNIEWVMQYWKIENAAVSCAGAGEHGFLVQNGKVTFVDL